MCAQTNFLAAKGQHKDTFPLQKFDESISRAPLLGNFDDHNIRCDSLQIDRELGNPGDLFR